MPRKKTKTTEKATKRAAKATHQTHGKVEKSKPSTLDQVWGDTGQSRYGTLNKKEYAQKVTDWTMTELQAHATSVSVIPVQNREMLEKKLLKEFDKTRGLI